MPSIADGTQGPIQGNTRARNADARLHAETPRSGLRSIFRSKKLTRDEAKTKLHEWYQAVADCTIREIKSARDAIKSREENVLNYFIDRSTNASAESFNSKLKAFRAQLRGIRDLPFFIFRICKVFG